MGSNGQYGTEEMAADIADALNEVTNAVTGETFSRAGGSHAFSVETPSGHKFIVTVTADE